MKSEFLKKDDVYKVLVKVPEFWDVAVNSTGTTLRRDMQIMLERIGFEKISYLYEFEIFDVTGDDEAYEKFDSYLTYIAMKRK